MTASTQTEATEGGETGLATGTIFNLSRAVVMVIDDNPYSLKLTTQTLLGFGIKTRHLCSDTQSAANILKTYPIDLLIVDGDMPDPDGYELVSWLRRSSLDPNAFVPTLMISSHTRESRVAKARDCGANFIITRPITAAILLERLLWMARDPRPFVQADQYSGPDRRFKDPQLPRGQVERRADLLRKAKVSAEQAEPSRELEV